MNKPLLYSRTLFVQGPADTLARFASVFGIKDRFVVEQDEDAALDYLDTADAALFYSAMKGDFTLYIEPNLWDMTDAFFQDRLRELSKQGIAIALPDEDAESPLSFVLFIDGKTQQVDIDEDEVFEENYIIGEPALRKRLSGLAN